ncbi:hypothetical protein RY831_19385 [Noviherbaspirillum sp. CPCC 100848]|uniref:Uncharacterized protein n=2 Tax=Noviherbaspirillum album TaxID=3080276 RepID=A0ABU6JCS7_9BURK|nr:hypothetical protein [Noviherbaspirillum sp. CPCC 100848]
MFNYSAEGRMRHANFPSGYTRPYGPIDPVFTRIEPPGEQARRPSTAQPVHSQHAGHIVPPRRRPAVINQAYLQYTKQEKLTKPRPYSPETQRESWNKNRVLLSSKSRQDRDTLIGLMRRDCRDYTAVDSNGRYLVPFDMGMRYEDENNVLRMINHKIRDLEPVDRVAVLGTFIDLHLPHLLHSSSVNHDLQRKAIKMLAELLPATVHSPNHRAHLLASLISQLNSNGISTKRKTDAGIFGTSGRPNSDLAVKLIQNELKAVRRKANKCSPETLHRLARSFDNALRGYDALGGRWSPLHTEQWISTFHSPKLAPWNWKY